MHTCSSGSLPTTFSAHRLRFGDEMRCSDELDSCFDSRSSSRRIERASIRYSCRISHWHIAHSTSARPANFFSAHTFVRQTRTACEVGALSNIQNFFNSFSIAHTHTSNCNLFAEATAGSAELRGGKSSLPRDCPLVWLPRSANDLRHAGEAPFVCWLVRAGWAGSPALAADD